MFEGLKHYMPRGIYGRAALILLLPVVTLQLVVSVVFIQRHFQGVTEQLSEDAARDLSYALTQVEAAPNVGRALEIRLNPADSVPAVDFRRWYDLTGLTVMRTLYQELPGLERLRLPDDRRVEMWVNDGQQVWAVVISRERVSASNPHQLLVNMVFFGILMTVIAYLYLRNQLRPITRLARAAEAFGRGRVEPYSPGGAVEVRAAGHAFLDMRARIERHIEQRTMMLSGISHDLRTPLTRLRLGLSLIEDADREPLERDVDEMQRLIDAFLEFARGDFEAGPPEATDPVALVETVVADAARAGNAVTLKEVDTSETVSLPALVKLRPASIRRALENLIANAVRYGTRCEVSVRVTEKSVRLRVEDDGPGIPADSRADAIRPFVRLDPARNQDRGSGVGLGLAIAADITRGHGGMLRLGESDDLGGLRVDIVIAR